MLPSTDMAQPAQRPATYEDVLAAPPHMVAQVLDGELHLHPRPARRHTRSASLLGARLASLFDDALQDDGGDWVVRFEPELHLGPDIPVPDLAAWRVARFPGDDDEDEAYFAVAPDWACEILSASTARIDRLKKVPIYAREGVGHLWLVDPRDRTIEVLRLREQTYELVGTWGGDEGPFVLPPFESAALPAAAFWGRTTVRPKE